MSFPRYPRYKDSGVEWLGEVPEHWGLRPLWTYFRRTKRIGYGAEELLSVYRDHGVIPKASRDDNFNNPSEDLDAYQLVEPGDLVINKMKAWQGSVAVSGHRGIVSPAYFVYSALHNENARYLHYLMRSPQYTAGYLSLSKGIRVGQWDLQPEYHSRMPVVQPPLAEQVTIANFLDEETSKIETLIAEQEELIELLKEKRQGVISHAVTRGLNPDAPMKPSGVEWLGDVPAHWEVRRVKAVSTFTTSGPRGWSDRVGDDGALFIQSGDLDDELRIRFAGAKRVRIEDGAEATRTRLLNGDVVVCITGAKTGNVAVCSEAPEDAYVNQHLCLVRPTSEIESAFLGHLLRSDIGQTYFSISQYGLKQGLSLDDVRNAPVLIPPMLEQKAIVEHISLRIKEFSNLLSEIGNGIGILNERRTALISAAVTGKIDVRGWADRAA